MSSKSTNEKILLIYQRILLNAFSDSDYWHLIGNDEILDELSDFGDADWIEIKDDLYNWKSNQIGVFKKALFSDYSNSHAEILDRRLQLHKYIEETFQ